MSDPLPFIIIGAGGSGLLAASIASSRGVNVVVLERNRKAGIKLLISGGGKCNVTHCGSPAEILAAFPLRQRRFLKPALYAYSSDMLRQFLNDEGVSTVARENGRVFPQSERAEDVVQAFLRAVQRHGGTVRLNTRVDGVQVNAGGVTGVLVEGVSIPAAAVMIATGGVSYSRTGTTGDGFSWAKEVGHTVVPLKPALAPIKVTPALPASWRGIALRNGVLSVFMSNRKIHQAAGDLLFTHEGISGPAALDCSNAASQYREASLVWDFLPGKDFPETDALLQQRIGRNRGKIIQSQLLDLMPNRIVPDLLARAGVPPETRGYILTGAQRKAVVRLLKEWTIGRVETVEIERGEVTAGGVALDEINPHTMESRKVPRLYFAGEVLDIDGPIGGYNLQAAFSTGAAAAAHVVRRQQGI